jgi:hypothetical protein
MQDLAFLIVLVLIPTAVVLITALLGNLISFDNRYINALVSAAVSSVVVVGFTAYAARSLPLKSVILLALAIACAVFVADLIGNWITFTNRLVNALAKAAVFAVPFSGFIYYLSPVLLTAINS